MKENDSDVHSVFEGATASSVPSQIGGVNRKKAVYARKILFKYPSNWSLETLKKAVCVPYNNKPALTDFCKGALVNELDNIIYLFSQNQIGDRELRAYPFYLGETTLQKWHGNDGRSFDSCKLSVKDAKVLFEAKEALPKSKTQSPKSFKSPLQRKQSQKAAFKQRRVTPTDGKNEDDGDNHGQEKKKEYSANTVEEILQMLYKRMGMDLSFFKLYQEYTQSGDFEILEVMIEHQPTLLKHESICNRMREVLVSSSMERKPSPRTSINPPLDKTFTKGPDPSEKKEEKEEESSKQLPEKEVEEEEVKGDAQKAVPLIFENEDEYDDYIANLPGITNYKELVFSFGDRTVLSIYLERRYNFYVLYECAKAGMTYQQTKRKLCAQMKVENKERVSGYKRFLGECEERIKFLSGEEKYKKPKRT